MPDARDALAALIQDALDGDSANSGRVAFGEYFGERTAGKILKAGWRPPRKDHPPHDVDVMYAAVCTVCGRDLQWDECVNDWTH